jgi:hypothetical protein
LEDFAATYENRYDIEFITPSPFEEIFSRH